MIKDYFRSIGRPITLFSLGIFFWIFLIYLFLCLRLPHFTRNLWGDEFHHNTPILKAQSFFEFMSVLAPQYQPFLEYALRKYFWFPILSPLSEFSLRVPNFAASFLTLIAAGTLSFWYFYKNQKGVFLSLCVSGIIGLWVCLHPLDITYANEARHYAWIHFVSILWFASLVLFQLEFFSWPMLGIHFLFMNSHFTGAFLIYLFGSALIAYDIWKRGRVQSNQIPHKLFRFSLLGFTNLFLNYRAWYWLLWFYKPGARPEFQEGLIASFESLTKFGEYLYFPIHPWILLTGSVLVGLVLKKREHLTVAFLGLFCIPFFLFYSRISSNYVFETRYYMPLFGFGFVLVLTLARYLLKPTLIYQTGSFLACIFGIQFAIGTPDFVSRSSLALPPQNFTPFFKLFEKVKSQNRPTLWIHSQSWASDIPEMYFDWIQPHTQSPHVIVDTTNNDDSVSQARDKIIRFFKEYAEGIVILDQKEKSCNEVKDPPVLKKNHLQLSWAFDKSLCAWQIEGVTQLEDLSEIISLVGFPVHEGIFSNREP
jgi:hypothetical protein